MDVIQKIKFVPLIQLIIVLSMTLFCCFSANADSQAYKGMTLLITPDKSCSIKPINHEMTLVFDTENSLSGWLYGEGVSAGELKRVSPTRFEVTYPITRYNNLPPSALELLPSKDGYHAVIQDYVPEDKEIRESLCFFEKLEADLKLFNGSKSDLINVGKELFAAELIMLEGSTLLLTKKEYKASLELGHKVLPFYERTYGRTSLEARNALSLVVLSLMHLERFDEALEAIVPYRKASPDHATLKLIEEMIIKDKKEQDDLFRYNPDSKGDAELEPLG